MKDDQEFYVVMIQMHREEGFKFPPRIVGCYLDISNAYSKAQSYEARIENCVATVNGWNMNDREEDA